MISGEYWSRASLKKKMTYQTTICIYIKPKLFKWKFSDDNWIQAFNTISDWCSRIEQYSEI